MVYMFIKVFLLAFAERSQEAGRKEEVPPRQHNQGIAGRKKEVAPRQHEKANQKKPQE